MSNFLGSGTRFPDTLPGATFVLEKYTSAEYQGEDKDWVEQEIVDSKNTTSGVFSFKDLSEGYYQLIEKVSPEGYVKTIADPRFRIKAEGNELKLYIVTVDGKEVIQTDMLKVDNYTINVGNEPGAALPSAGGPGTHMIYLIGAILIFDAGWILIRREIWGRFPD